MSKLPRDLLLLSLPTLLAVALLEILLRTVVVASTPPRGYFEAGNAIYRFDPELPTGVFTRGPLARDPATWEVNAQGWLSTVDYTTARERDRARIAVIGDSYVEALEVGTAHAFPTLLGELLEGAPEVYAFGTSGAPLSQYLHLARHVARRYDPDLLVIAVVHNDFAESLAALNPGEVQFMRLASDGNGGLHEEAPTANPAFLQFHPLKRFARRSALVRYLYLNCHIKETLQGLRYLLQHDEHATYSENIDVTVLREARSDIVTAIDYVVAALARENRGRRVLIMMDGRRQQIYAKAADLPTAFLHDELRAASRRHGIDFLDLHPLMAAAYEVDERPFNPPDDGHWNRYGHAFVARALAAHLRAGGTTLPLAPDG